MGDAYKLPTSLTKEEKEMLYRYCEQFKSLGFWNEEKGEPRLRSRIVKMWIRGFDAVSKAINSNNFSICVQCKSTFWCSKEPIVKCHLCNGETMTHRQLQDELDQYKEGGRKASNK